ncbi:MAG: hypothetical protein KKB50_00990 [Planctomycetes bacterium]|nr:hypothetical protein [Planctomycetota bacterium]
MARREKRWRIWKIGLATAGCLAATLILFWVSTLVEDDGANQPPGPMQRSSSLTVAGFMVMIAAIAAALTLLCLIWLALRIREARLPAWERGRKKKRHGGQRR